MATASVRTETNGTRHSEHRSMARNFFALRRAMIVVAYALRFQNILSPAIALHIMHDGTRLSMSLLLSHEYGMQ